MDPEEETVHENLIQFDHEGASTFITLIDGGDVSKTSTPGCKRGNHEEDRYRAERELILAEGMKFDELPTWLRQARPPHYT